MGTWKAWLKTNLIYINITLVPEAIFINLNLDLKYSEHIFILV